MDGRIIQNLSFIVTKANITQYNRGRNESHPRFMRRWIDLEGVTLSRSGRRSGCAVWSICADPRIYRLQCAPPLQGAKRHQPARSRRRRLMTVLHFMNHLGTSYRSLYGHNGSLCHHHLTARCLLVWQSGRRTAIRHTNPTHDSVHQRSRLDHCPGALGRTCYHARG